MNSSRDSACRVGGRQILDFRTANASSTSLDLDAIPGGFALSSWR
ncbi:MAG: hypothetical protein AAFR21_12920 [Pseudomonadota bacterium]